MFYSNVKLDISAIGSPFRSLLLGLVQAFSMSDISLAKTGYKFLLSTRIIWSTFSVYYQSNHHIQYSTPIAVYIYINFETERTISNIFYGKITVNFLDLCSSLELWVDFIVRTIGPRIFGLLTVWNSRFLDVFIGKLCV